MLAKFINAHAPLVVVMDFDGTLVPFNAQKVVPDNAHLLKWFTELAGRPNCEVIIIESGRDTALHEKHLEQCGKVDDCCRAWSFA